MSKDVVKFIVPLTNFDMSFSVSTNRIDFHKGIYVDNRRSVSGEIKIEENTDIPQNNLIYSDHGMKILLAESEVLNPRTNKCYSGETLRRAKKRKIEISVKLLPIGDEDGETER